MAPPRSSPLLFLFAALAAVVLLVVVAAPLSATASAFPETLDAGDASLFSDEALAHLSESLTKCE